MPRPLRTAALAIGVAGLAAARTRAGRRPDAGPPPAPAPPPPPPLPPRPVPERRSALVWVLFGLGVAGIAALVLGFFTAVGIVAVMGLPGGRDAALWALASSAVGAVVGPVLGLTADALDDRRKRRNDTAEQRWRRAVGRAVADAGGASAYEGSGYSDYAIGLAIASGHGGGHGGGYDGGYGGGYDGGGYSDGGGGGGVSSYS